MKTIIKSVVDYITKLFEKDNVLKIASGLAAILIWFIISVEEYPNVDRVIYKVPVSVDLQGTYAESQGFKPVSMSDEYVTVYLTGNRSQVGSLNTDDLVAVANADNVIDTKEYKLSLKIISKSNKTFSITSVEPSEITVDFDEIVTQEIPVEADIKGVKVDSSSGYMKGTPVATPGTINVTGPKEKIKTIEKAVVKIESQSILNTTTELTSSEISIYNKSGAVVSNENGLLTYDKTTFSVQVPIYVKKTVPLKVSIINEPESFNKDIFIDKLKLSANELVIAAPNDKINEIESLTIGTIDMRRVDIGSVFSYKTDDFLPDGYENLSGIDSITVTCPSDGLAKKIISIRGSSVQFVNAPAQFEFNMITSGFTMSFVGPEDEIQELTTLDIVAQIDLIDFDMTEGDKRLPVTFLMPSYNDIWCISEGVITPTAVVTATKK
jgi:YbbR domain-containing protein